MDNFKKYNENEIRIIKVNLSRATMNEAQEIKENLIEDLSDHKMIVVDLSDCQYVDSTFIGALVYSLKRYKETSGDIKLVISDSLVNDTFILSDIERVFSVYHSIQDAISAYQGDEGKLQ